MDAPVIRMREQDAPPRAGSHNSNGLKLDTGWHSHDMHEILYAFEDSLEIESTDRHFMAPPQLAAFIPTGAIHRTCLKGRRSGAVFLPPSLLDVQDRRVRILRVSPLMREMLLEAMRWPVGKPETEIGRCFFRAFALLCGEWLEDEAPFHLPTSDDPKIRRAMELTSARLADVECADICRAVHMSERSLRRHFLKETGMRWHDYRHRARMLQAMALLETTRQPLTEVALAVGFSGLSGFSRAFARFSGEPPREFRNRVQAPPR